MTLVLTQEEQEQLDQLCERYEYASLLWHLTFPTKDSQVFRVEKVDLVEWRDVVRAEKKFLPGMHGTLRTKVTNLFNKTA